MSEACMTCESDNTRRTGTAMVDGTKNEFWHCNDCGADWTTATMLSTPVVSSAPGDPDRIVVNLHDGGTITVKRQDAYFINVYEVTRHYGGPEEGGWYYNVGTPKDSVFTSDPHSIPRIRKWFIEKYGDEAHGDIYSVNGGLEIQVIVEDHPSRRWPDRRPVYC